jgi:hypothetical protein
MTTTDIICAFTPFLLVNHCIKIPNINLEAFAESHVGELSFPNQIAHGPKRTTKIARSFRQR